jgi:ankyrin repeat protein
MQFFLSLIVVALVSFTAARVDPGAAFDLVRSSVFFVTGGPAAASQAAPTTQPAASPEAAPRPTPPLSPPPPPPRVADEIDADDNVGGIAGDNIGTAANVADDDVLVARKPARAAAKPKPKAAAKPKPKAAAKPKPKAEPPRDPEPSTDPEQQPAEPKHEPAPQQGQVDNLQPQDPSESQPEDDDPQAAMVREMFGEGAKIVRGGGSEGEAQNKEEEEYKDPREAEKLARQAEMEKLAERQRERVERGAGKLDVDALGGGGPPVEAPPSSPPSSSSPPQKKRAGPGIKDPKKRRRAELELLRRIVYEDAMGVQSILDLGISPNFAGASPGEFDGEPKDAMLPPLVLAADMPRPMPAVLELLVEYGARLDQTDPRGHTALTIAAQDARTDHLDVVAWLIERGADLDHRAGDEQFTALHYASFEGNYRMAKALVRAGASLTVPDRGGRTVLHVAAGLKDPRFIELLLKSIRTKGTGGGGGTGGTGGTGGSGSKMSRDEVLEARDTYGRTVLDVTVREAPKRGAEDRIALIAAHYRDSGVSLDQRGADGGYALHLLAYELGAERARILLEHGASPLVRDVRGRTPAHIAVVRGDAECLAVLLNATLTAGRGMDALRIKDVDGRTPSDVAMVAPADGRLLRAMIDLGDTSIDKDHPALNPAPREPYGDEQGESKGGFGRLVVVVFLCFCCFFLCLSVLCMCFVCCANLGFCFLQNIFVIPKKI